ncbi:hypothetical protein LMG31841_04135 [Paraburkholderia saeva]|uniref:Uncharacterized protein n=1 Tax=Paraburkholderia saeva TaxID=2777537 RepID=A0A9N8S080_9BURK|nr:hypothetical protein R70241_00944 [Paraburkholderia saeva]CAG4912115.1 hypothetical protein LMG31841_04135 [Paraburkholderia saeva]
MMSLQSFLPVRKGRPIHGGEALWKTLATATYSQISMKHTVLLASNHYLVRVRSMHSMRGGV